MKTLKYKKEDKEILAIYLKEINNVDILDRNEEIKYAKLAKKGDKLAKEKIIKSNLRFVVNVAKKYQNQGLALADLISEGNIGLLSAIQKFDVERGYHFISYAVWWIRQSILKAIYEKSRLIRLPSNKANELIQIEKLRKSFEKEYSNEEEILKIAKELNLDRDNIANLLSISKDQISLESNASPNSSSQSTKLDFLQDEDQNNDPEYIATKSVLNNDLKGLMHKVLNSKELDVIESRFGLSGEGEESLKEIGSRLKFKQRKN